MLQQGAIKGLFLTAGLALVVAGCSGTQFRTAQSAFTHDSVCNTRVANEAMARAGGVLDRHDRRLGVITDFGFQGYERMSVRDEQEHCQAGMWFETSVENLPEVLIQHLQAVNDQSRAQIVDSSMVQDMIRQSQDVADPKRVIRIELDHRYIQVRRDGLGQRVHEVKMSEPLYWTMTRQLRES